MAVSINWGFLIVGVLISRAVLFFGSILGPLFFGNSNMASLRIVPQIT